MEAAAALSVMGSKCPVQTQLNGRDGRLCLCLQGHETRIAVWQLAQPASLDTTSPAHPQGGFVAKFTLQTCTTCSVCFVWQNIADWAASTASTTLGHFGIWRPSKHHMVGLARNV